MSDAQYLVFERTKRPVYTFIASFSRFTLRSSGVKWLFNHRFAFFLST